MLLELAIRDAYSIGFTYVNLDVIRKHDALCRYVRHPWHWIRHGSYTDDTQMSIAEALVANAA